MTLLTNLFLIAFFSGLTLALLSLATLVVPAITFWPPPSKGSWQYVLFWLLFRIMFLGIVILGYLDFAGAGQQTLWQFVLGLPLALFGFGLAFRITYALGWDDAHGEANALTTGGWYRYSRNPIYVASIVGMLGVGMVIHSFYVYSLLSLWALLYLVAPLLEEPWLEQRYGTSYQQYKLQVARFVGRHR